MSQEALVAARRGSSARRLPLTGTAATTLRMGGERARAGCWRADRSVAFLAPLPDGRPVSAEFARYCLKALAAKGYERVVTGALGRHEQRGFVEAGFEVQEQLHLLVLDAPAPLPPAPPGPAVRRARFWRKTGVLEVDAAAFSPFWRLDRAGLREALGATESARLRVVLGEGHKVEGYAICGASGGRGFVQRLAVVPQAQGRGLGKRLLMDGLVWLRKAGAAHVAVNTQKGNGAALALYRWAGFREDPDGLCVLSARTGATVPD
ncbi:MAG TPA: GNAT family N-acetyltransferase [Acidimicrobiales bacterium]|nr:GNAT family N-acetyltransferase [Acidimicrobiales bacterium]